MLRVKSLNIKVYFVAGSLKQLLIVKCSIHPRRALSPLLAFEQSAALNSNSEANLLFHIL